ncbi:hypothetical protein BDL97_02G146600 [Sphagnum fallax]|jgi:DNA repair exonuclease SbcCD ATPase subunit|nr:hypothetical protein BDL97_02G146600 [Sphagnum fallax]KAH8971506.1 hypothetical protein BDL97_02G146600 [Sphagnum fallax]
MDGDGGYGGGKGMGFLKPKSQRKPAAKKRESPSRNEYLQNASPSKKARISKGGGGAVHQTDHQHRVQGVTKKAVKKGLGAANQDLAALDNEMIMQNYQALRQKYKALQEESVLVAEELESADAEVKKLQEKNEALMAEVKKLQEEKYGLLDQLLVFEGLSVDPFPPFKIRSGHCHISHDDS